MRHTRHAAAVRILAALPIAISLPLAGCYSGIGAEHTFYAGEFEAASSATPERLAATTREAMAARGDTIVSSKADSAGGEIIGRGKDGKFTTVRLKALSASTTKVYIRSGENGDEAASAELFEKIKPGH